MFPIGDQEVRGGERALINGALIIFNVAVFVFMVALNQEAQRTFINQYGVIPEEILQGQNLYALLTSMFLHGGLAVSVAHIALNAGSSVPSVGDSGAVAAVLGAYIVMFPGSKVKALVLTGAYMRVTRVTALLFIGIRIVLQFFYGFASLGVETAQTGGVAYFAHIGGFILGLIGGSIFQRSNARLA